MTTESLVNLLDEMVETLGLAQVAERTGYSKSAICHVQRGTYRGNTSRVLAKVEAVFAQRPVSCPILGEIPFSRCMVEQNRPFAAVNPLRVRLARTCPKCEVTK